VLGVTGFTWVEYRNLDSGLTRSTALDGADRSAGSDINILIMGLDSRLDQNGDPLPQDVYDALHAGGSENGGYNANVLMLVHIPGDGGRAIGISIPRDDYVDLPGKPSGIAKGKIKQAYGFAKNDEWNRLYAAGERDRAILEQRSRDAGRRAEVAAVRQFLGGVPVDHFIEVTLGGFFEVAKVLAPITVCLNRDTYDSYSGANFHAGVQQIDAAQAVAFVRQRRDTKYEDVVLTDLDRERRQQAFLASVGHQLKQADTFTDPSKLTGLIDVVKRAVVIDSELDLAAMGGTASALAGGNITFTTLPIKGFGRINGEDVNLVDVEQVRQTVRELLGMPAPPAPPSATVDIVNASGKAGIAASLSDALRRKGYADTTTDSARQTQRGSTIRYAPDAEQAATALAALLGDDVRSTEDDDVPGGHVRVTLGSSFTMPPALSSASSSPPSKPEPSDQAPEPTQPAPEIVPGGQVPCVN